MTMNKCQIAQYVEQLECRYRSACTCGDLDIHGLPHLRQVALVAGRFAAHLGEDVEAAMVMGFFHDCARIHDGGGTQHAHDSAQLARPIITADFPHFDVARLCDGIAHHADGTITDDFLIGCLWDADRLDLRRLGITPNPRLLSTPIARRVARLYQ